MCSYLPVINIITNGRINTVRLIIELRSHYPLQISIDTSSTCEWCRLVYLPPSPCRPIFLIALELWWDDWPNLAPTYYSLKLDSCEFILLIVQWCDNNYSLCLSGQSNVADLYSFSLYIYIYFVIFRFSVKINTTMGWFCFV